MTHTTFGLSYIVAWLCKSHEGYTNVPEMLLQFLWYLLRRYVCDASFSTSSARSAAVLRHEAEDNMAAFVLGRVAYAESVLSYTDSLIQPHPYLSSHYNFFVKIYSCQLYPS